MAKLEYEADCLCDGKIKCLFKKPTQMQHTVASTRCNSCKSSFMFTCQVRQNENGRYYFTDHTVTEITDYLMKKIKEKKEEAA